jgi:homoserine kinase
MTDDAPSATALAPATVGNAAVGFDILGFAVDAVADRVTVRRIETPTVRIDTIEGVTTDVPAAAEQNTATIGLLQLIGDLDLSHGFEVDLHKGIPLGSGMGGSAASAVAGIVAAAELIEPELSRETLLDYALMGEAVASGARHGDNVAPCLFGGLALVRSVDSPDVVDIPVPDSIRCVLVHPHLEIETKRARSVVPNAFPLSNYVEQSTRLASFIAGCHQNDLELIGDSLEDVLIEPHRAILVPGFSKVKAAALDAGALGCSLSGAGPSLFAWCDSEDRAETVEMAMLGAFADAGIEADAWISPIEARGARIVESYARISS